MAFGAASLALHLMPGVELYVWGLDEYFVVPLLDLLLEGRDVHPRQRVSVQGYQLRRNLKHIFFIPSIIEVGKFVQIFDDGKKLFYCISLKKSVSVE